MSVVKGQVRIRQELKHKTWSSYFPFPVAAVGQNDHGLSRPPFWQTLASPLGTDLFCPRRTKSVEKKQKTWPVSPSMSYIDPESAFVCSAVLFLIVGRIYLSGCPESSIGFQLELAPQPKQELPWGLEGKFSQNSEWDWNECHFSSTHSFQTRPCVTYPSGSLMLLSKIFFI